MTFEIQIRKGRDNRWRWFLVGYFGDDSKVYTLPTHSFADPRDCEQWVRHTIYGFPVRVVNN